MLQAKRSGGFHSPRCVGWHYRETHQRLKTLPDLWVSPVHTASEYHEVRLDLRSPHRFIQEPDDVVDVLISEWGRQGMTTDLGIQAVVETPSAELRTKVGQVTELDRDYPAILANIPPMPVPITT
jgi:hypothetical protein